MTSQVPGKPNLSTEKTFILRLCDKIETETTLDSDLFWS